MNKCIFPAMVIVLGLAATVQSADIRIINAVSSSVEKNSSEVAAKYACDGKMETRWASQQSDPQWIYFDLGGIKVVNIITINWEAAFAKEYAVEISNDAEKWREVFREKNGDGGVDEIYTGEQRARYVRMKGIQRGTQWGYSIYEFNAGFAAGIKDVPATEGFRAVPGNGAVFLKWKPGSAEIAGYNVYRSASLDIPFQKINKTAVKDIGYADKTAENGKRYHYFVKAYKHPSCEGKSTIVASAVPELQNKPALITVNAAKELGRIDRLKFGSLMCCYTTDADTEIKDHFTMGSQYGFGMWDPDTHETVKETIALGREAGIPILRAIGMWEYWKDGVAIPGKTRKFDFGVDERMKYCSELGAEMMVCFDSMMNHPRDFRNFCDLFDYLNGEADPGLVSELKSAKREELFRKYVQKNGNLFNWANMRALNGRVEPYGVKYVEIGNEIYCGNISAKRYSEMYIEYYDWLKIRYPYVQVGVVGCNCSWNHPWDAVVSGIIKDKMDFVVMHLYAGTPYGLHPDKMYKINAAVAEVEVRPFIKDTVALYKANAGKKVPIAVTEYNSAWYSEHRQYMHTMGVAVAVSELLKTFIECGDDILSAHHFNFTNEAFGMVSNVFWTDWTMLHDPYYKRPNYHVLKMYSKHFGEILTECGVQCEKYSLLEEGIENLGEFHQIAGKTGDDLLKNAPMDSAAVDEGGGVYRIDLLGADDKTYFRTLKTCDVKPGAYYRLSFDIKTDLIDAGGEDYHDTLIGAQDVRGWGAVNWEARSAVVKGESDPAWVDVERVFRVPGNINRIQLMFQRWSEKPLKQKTYLKDMRLCEFTPDRMEIDYITALASKSKDGKKLYLIVNNRNIVEDVCAKVSLNGFKAGNTAKIISLYSEDATDSNEEGIRDKVRPVEDSAKISGNEFSYNFKKCSVTAVEIAGAE
ncbi:MAG: discoidin domain-containing protein [Elusimicrobiota bacterium]